MRQNVSSVCILALASLLLAGCYSFETLKPAEGERLLDSNTVDLRVRTTADSVIDMDAGKYGAVYEPGERVLGVGVVREQGAGRANPFRGEIRATTFWQRDTTLWLDENTRLTGPTYSFLTREKATIHVPERSLLFVKKSDGTGIWGFGTIMHERESSTSTLDRTKASLFRGRIPFEDIKSLERRELSYAKTIPLVIVTAAVVAALGWGLSRLPRYADLGGH